METSNARTHRSIAIGSEWGRTSRRTGLELPLLADVAQAIGATKFPALILGGDVHNEAATVDRAAGAP